MDVFVIQPTVSGLLIIFQSALMVVGSILESPLLGPRLWRKLPPDLTSVKTLNIFKSRTRKNDISSMIDDGCKSCSFCTS